MFPVHRGSGGAPTDCAVAIEPLGAAFPEHAATLTAASIVTNTDTYFIFFPALKEKVSRGKSTSEKGRCKQTSVMSSRYRRAARFLETYLYAAAPTFLSDNLSWVKSGYGRVHPDVKAKIVAGPALSDSKWL